MLAALSIRDIVLIDKLDLEFGQGLSALTGETGAGKSILLDAFSLAIGGRGTTCCAPYPTPALPGYRRPKARSTCSPTSRTGRMTARRSALACWRRPELR